MIALHLIIDKLRNELNYPEHMIPETARKILELDDTLKPGFLQWFKTGVYPSINIEGYTIKRLIDEEAMTVISAFITMDALIKEPNLAKDALAYGKDRIRVN
ncbi:MAG: hypothetical protein AB2421_02700 [Thermotaleaceae bacterium]